MINKLTDSELETYARQIVLKDIGYDGQLKIRNARACLIGIGGLGSPTALKLTGLGIGMLRIVERDIVSKSDLHRQYLYGSNSIGRPKVEVALERLTRLNPDVKLEVVPESLNSMNSEDLIKGMDIVIDGLDRPEPRYIVNRTCIKLNVPYVFGAAIESFGQVTTLIPGKTLCLECFMSDIKDEDVPSCGRVGVHPSVLGIVSSVQVAEAIRILTGRPPNLFNKLLYVDVAKLEFKILNVSALDTCKVCGKLSTGMPNEIADRFFEETCSRDGRRNFVISPRSRLDVDINKLAAIIKDNHLRIKSVGTFGVTFEKQDLITACILRSCIMIAQTPPNMEENYKRQVLDIYKKIFIQGLGLPISILPD